ncbi:MAG TPA: TIGR02266 family protein [Kofleriaceae bacterium]|nr:TIGR02266 family protein [Kofleriaceae bacterium]
MAGHDDPKSAAAPLPSEKRRSYRADVTLVVEYEGADELLVDWTDNLSAGGTFVATSRELPVDTVVRLGLSFPGLLEPVHIDGVVRWSRGGDDPGVGIEFLDGDGRTRLGEVIERIRCRDPRTVARLIRVLVVEDNPHVAGFLGDGLAHSGKKGGEVAFLVRTAQNGREALTALRTETFDALIIDIYLPVIDGSMVIEAVRTELKLKELPIIAVSAGGDTARATALAAGANFFIDKPMRLRQVIDTMRSLMKL